MTTGNPASARPAPLSVVGAPVRFYNGTKPTIMSGVSSTKTA